MTSSIETLASAALSPVPLLLNGLRQISVAIIAARQKQADIRVAMHVRGLPRDVLQRLGLPTDAVGNLRHPDDWSCERTRKKAEPAGKIMGKD